MSTEISEEYADTFRSVFRAFFFREPKAEEYSRIFGSIDSVESMVQAINKMQGSREHLKRMDNMGYPPGHFYSALVDVDDAKSNAGRIFNNSDPFVGIKISDERMDGLWKDLDPYFRECPFPETEVDDFRYYFRNNAFPFTDGMVFSALLRHLKPKRVIEVGSGFTSACMLDTQERFLDYEIDITFIQPYPHTIGRLLRDEDRNLYKLVEKKVQDVDLSLFDSLESGDILFIDSTHVAKTGSDVLFEVLEVLPALKAGVHIHFHDIFYPFEYPRDWVINHSRSWNEIYLLRAFLMGNGNYEVTMFNNYYTRQRLHDSSWRRERFVENPGGSLWMLKTGTGA